MILTASITFISAMTQTAAEKWERDLITAAGIVTPIVIITGIMLTEPTTGIAMHRLKEYLSQFDPEDHNGARNVILLAVAIIVVIGMMV